VAAAWADIAHHHPDPERRKQAKGIYEFMVPIVKGWSTEMSIDVASAGVQVHGGMGYIEETGAAQFYRDARILTIYEGTTAIQANDFVGRKTARDGGAVARALIGQMRQTATELSGSENADLAAIGRRLSVAVDAYAQVVDYVVSQMKADIRGVFAGSVPYLKLAGIVHGGWQLGRAAAVSVRALAAGGNDRAFHAAKIGTARYFADHVLTSAGGLRDSIVDGAAGVLALSAEQF
jgi:butyryl-CoA dehydrogenase